MSRIVTTALMVLSVTFLVGCSPRVRIRKSPGDHDKGIRYYRPKPYLLIEPAGSVVTSTDKKTSTATPSDEFVSISVEYMPDFSEEYSINVSPGLGSAKVNVTLDNGWNLTSLNQELDSQFDENVGAIAELAKAGASFIPTGGNGIGPDGPAGSKKKWVVRSTNVPIGYYEAVIGESCGKKRLYGWRYVGFVPYSACPTKGCGSESLQCNDLNAQIYGLVFENGVMVFKQINSISRTPQTGRDQVGTGEYEIANNTTSRITSLENAVQKSILQNYGVDSVVIATLQNGTASLSIDIDGGASVAKTREDFVKSLLQAGPLADELAVQSDLMVYFTVINGLSAPAPAAGAVPGAMAPAPGKMAPLPGAMAPMPDDEDGN